MEVEGHVDGFRKSWLVLRRQHENGFRVRKIIHFLKHTPFRSSMFDTLYMGFLSVPEWRRLVTA